MSLSEIFCKFPEKTTTGALRLVCGFEQITKYFLFFFYIWSQSPELTEHRPVPQQGSGDGFPSLCSVFRSELHSKYGHASMMINSNPGLLAHMQIPHRQNLVIINLLSRSFGEGEVVAHSKYAPGELHSYLQDEEGYGGFSSSFSEKAVRMAFIRKVYAILCAQVPTENNFFAPGACIKGCFSAPGILQYFCPQHQPHVREINKHIRYATVIKK